VKAILRDFGVYDYFLLYANILARVLPKMCANFRKIKWNKKS